jgi:sugar-specific transcriptional regulator TrmB
MKKITDYLQRLGLSETEAILYKGLLEKGSTTIKDLAQQTGIKRITAHFNIENLIDKGLVVQTMRGARRQIVAEPPERIYYLLEQKLDDVKSLQRKFPDLLKSLKPVHYQSKENKEVEIKYYEGKQAVLRIYAEALKAKEFRAYVNCCQLAQAFPKNIDIFLKTHKVRKEMRVWEIMERSPEALTYIKKMPKERYYYKIIPKGVNLSVIDYMMFDGKVAIVDLEKNTTGIVISNKHYYNNAKAIYELVWKMLS